jgi:hypothetical protein
MESDAPKKLLCQTYVLREQLYVAFPTNLLQRQPYLERSKPARVLRAEVVVVCRFDTEMVVRRVIGKCFAQALRISEQRADRVP